MNCVEANGEKICAIYVDMGTTNTSVWLMRGSQLIARANRAAGVRDTARDGSPKRIHAAFRELVAEVRSEAARVSDSCVPMGIAAAGMIGSPLGLVELPHVPTPAGIQELAASSRWFQFPDLTDLPILLIPGVRSGPAHPNLHSIHQMDVMRGEETLCVGLNALGLANSSVVVLNLGSHWKAIRLDAQGRIDSSTTSLSGELIHAAQTDTILASSVRKERPSAIAGEWMEAGMKEQRRSGLPRALFCVRLLELSSEGTLETRLAFLLGAFIACDVDALVSQGVLVRDTRVVIAGSAAVAEAWRSALAQLSVPSSVLAATETEQALLTGLRLVLVRAGQRRAPRSLKTVE